MQSAETQDNVINFAKAKQRLALDVISIGDRVEWSDWNTEQFQGRVTKIEYITDDDSFGSVNSEDLTHFPIWEKSEYCVTLEAGLSVAGSVIVRKIPRGEKAKVAGQAPRKGGSL